MLTDKRRKAIIKQAIMLGQAGKWNEIVVIPELSRTNWTVHELWYAFKIDAELDPDKDE